MATREAELRSALGEDSDEVVAYIISLIDDHEEEGSSTSELLDELVVLMSGHAIDSSESDIRAAASRVLSAPAAPTADPAPPPASAPASTPAAAASPRPSPRDRPTSEPSEPSEPSERERFEPATQAMVRTMQALVPGASVDVCHHLIQRHGGCDEAADVLLSTPLEALEAQARDAAAAAAAAKHSDKQAEKAARKAAVSRYGSVSARPRGDDAPLKLEPPRLPYSGTRKEALKQNVTRYRDGEARVMKAGEKFVTEEKEEWDGGSRGRVKTKGKRGPGFV